MSVAIRTAVRIQDQDDAPTLGAGQDGYALTWDNASGAFVATALVTDHGGLSGLSDDDHTGYALLAGRAGGQTLYGGTDANDDITIHGTSNATRTTSYVLLQPTAGNVGIGTSAPAYTLEVAGIVASGSASVGGEFRSYQVPIASKNCIGLGTNDGENRSGLVRYLNDISIGYFLFYDTSTGDTSLNVVFTGAAITMQVANVEKARLSNAGNFGIGTTTPATLLHAVSTTATTDALRNVLTLGANVTSTGVGAAGLGPAILFTAESSTTADTTQARIAALWNDHTHSQFKSDLVGYASDAAAEREIWRGRANGSAPAIGFLGATPQARIAHVADPAGGATVDAEARSAINSILSTLELFGFHAAS